MLYNKILKQIKPTDKEKEKVRNIVSEFTKLLDKNLTKSKTFVGGSFAKNTWLKDKHDVDVFVLFDKEINIPVLEKAIKKSFKTFETVHGSRDYFIIKFKSIIFEVIPVLKISSFEQSQNTTDLSPMHVSWVNTHIGNLQDDVLICKQFLKANDCYGAETFIGGLHGYLVEILIIHFKGFNNFIKNISKLKPELIIDPNGHSKFISEQQFPLTVIDPVNPERNVSAALTQEKLDLLIKISKEYLRKPSEKMFVKQKLDLSKYNLILKSKPVEGSVDVSGTKLLKAYEKILSSMKDEGFVILSTTWDWDKECFYCFKLKDKKLSPEYKHFGPPIENEEHYEAFKDKYLGAKMGVEKGKSFVMLEREFKDSRSFVENLIKKDDYIKSKVKSIEIVKA